MKNCFIKAGQKSLLVFTLLVSFFAKAQNVSPDLRSQLSVTSENDAYTFQHYDRYYTNGLMIRFSKALGKVNEVSNSRNKKILNAEIGQLIFTPHYHYAGLIRRFFDRPFTGFLYAKGGVTYLTPKQNMFQWNVIAGTIGSASKAKEVQTLLHNTLPFTSYLNGWQRQLQSEFGVNVQGAYYYHLLKPTAAKRFMDAHAKANAIIGNTYTQFSSGVLLKFGNFENAERSAWWSARLAAGNEQKKYKHELFFYVEPSVTYQVYNATVQGGLFLKPKDKYAKPLEPYFFSNSFGVLYARNRWTTQVGYTFKTKEAKPMVANEFYGTIALAYRFK